MVCRTSFSFHEGASTPEEIVNQAASLGLSAVAITDRDGVYGIPRAHKAAKAAGVRILPGSSSPFETVQVSLCSRETQEAGLSYTADHGGSIRHEEGWGQAPPGLAARAQAGWRPS